MEGPPGGFLMDISSSHSGLFAAASFTEFEGVVSTIQLWSLNPLRCTAEVSRPHDNRGRQSALALVDDAKALLGTSEGFVELWDLNHGQEAPTVMTNLHNGPILGVKSASSAPSIALTAGSLDQTLKLWDLRTNACVRSMAAGAPVVSADMDANGSLAVSNGFESKLKLWDLGSGGCMAEFDLPSSMMTYPQVVMHGAGDAFMASFGGEDGSTVAAWSVSDTSGPVTTAHISNTNFNSHRLVAARDLSSIGIVVQTVPREGGTYSLHAKVWV